MKRRIILKVLGVFFITFTVTCMVAFASMAPGSGSGQYRGIQLIPNYEGYWSTGLLNVDVGAQESVPVKMDLLLSEGVIEQAIYAGEGNLLLDQNENLFHANKGVFTIHYTADGERILNMIFVTEYPGDDGEWVSASEFVIRAKFEVYGDVMTFNVDLGPDGGGVNGGGDGVFDNTHVLADGEEFNPEYDFIATLFRQ